MAHCALTTFEGCWEAMSSQIKGQVAPYTTMNQRHVKQSAVADRQ